MRFCPFCSAENADEATHCVTCARRLPPLAPRRRKGTRADQTPAPVAAGAATRAVQPGGDGDGDEWSGPHQSGSLLSKVSIGPASKRRSATAPEPREAGAPARRASDDTAPPDERARALPPTPSRTQRDQAAAAHASERVPRSDTSGTPTPAHTPHAAALAPAATAQPLPRLTDKPMPIAPLPPGQNPLPSGVKQTEPLGSLGDEEWPAPAPAPRSADPDDWGAEAQTSVQTRPPEHTPSPARPPAAAEYTPNQPASRQPSRPEPPPTRVKEVRERAFVPPKLAPMPDVPERGLWNAVAYFVTFLRAGWQRRSAVKVLNAEIQEDTAALDNILGTLGKQTRSLSVDNRILSGENKAIDDAEARKHQIEHTCSELSNRQAEENAKFGEIESERELKANEAESTLERAQQELGSYEAQRRGLRDKRKTVERQQKGYIKAAEDRDEQASKAMTPDARSSLRRAAEDLRRDAARLDPERQDLDRRLTALEKPMSQSMAKVEALKAELESARRSLNDAREGHRHRLAEVEAEQGRKSRELAQADAEIQRRLVTLGTLVNLHRIETPEFDALYARIDRLRGAIGARSTEIDRLSAEREAYDRGSLWRGFAVLMFGAVALVTLIVILLWVF